MADEEEFLEDDDLEMMDEPEATATIKDQNGTPQLSINHGSINNSGEIAFDNDTGKAVYITMTVSYSQSEVPHTVKVGS